MFLPLYSASILLSTSLSFGAPIVAAEIPKCANVEQKPTHGANSKPLKTVYKAVSRLKETSQSGSYGTYDSPSPGYGRGLNVELRQNGSSVDVGAWELRKDILEHPPFLFTLEPGRSDKTYTIAQLSLDETPGAKLAYTQGDPDIQVNGGTTAAFILTKEGNTKSQLVDDWTVNEVNGKKYLGLARLSNAQDTQFDAVDGYIWTLGASTWFNPDPQNPFSDGFYFINPPGDAGYGQSVYIELVEDELRKYK
ncbi:hypothetical protein CC78DRAFT_73145 [Lojkania enalia]|uniref:Uncharacterized protein n=1 Tax=Lojkania enalia TaxID=147567 RepID=A0A9P4K0M0_9PLEO|nr:hypothetical protein CC78DRAFT_73145 [Didymosphaeria enalia]